MQIPPNIKVTLPVTVRRELRTKADAARQYQRLAMQNVNEGEGGAPKVMTQADVLATARSSGKTPQQVIEAAKARGYTIQ